MEGIGKSYGLDLGHGASIFSLSVTGSGMIVYGAYLSDDEDIVEGAKYTALFDVIAAMVAALVIIPACYAYNVDVAAGPGLLFVTLLYYFAKYAIWQIVCHNIIYSCSFGGVSSLQNMFEVVGESLMYRFLN